MLPSLELLAALSSVGSRLLQGLQPLLQHRCIGTQPFARPASDSHKLALLLECHSFKYQQDNQVNITGSMRLHGKVLVERHTCCSLSGAHLLL